MEATANSALNDPAMLLQFHLEVERRNKPAKFLRVPRLALLNDVDEVVREDEGNPFPFDAELGLEVAEDVTEVYVEELMESRGNSEAELR